MLLLLLGRIAIQSIKRGLLLPRFRCDWSVCVRPSVCLFVATMNCTKTDEPIEMLFVMSTRLEPCVSLSGGPGSLHDKGQFWGAPAMRSFVNFFWPLGNVVLIIIFTVGSKWSRGMTVIRSITKLAGRPHQQSSHEAELHWSIESTHSTAGKESCFREFHLKLQLLLLLLLLLLISVIVVYRCFSFWSHAWSLNRKTSLSWRWIGYHFAYAYVYIFCIISLLSVVVVWVCCYSCRGYELEILWRLEAP